MVEPLYAKHFYLPCSIFPFILVKIISNKNDSFDLALRKRLFCDAKPTLLACKTATFGMQNNRFYKSLTTSELNNRYSCEIFLQLCYLISLYIKGVRERKTSGRQKSTFYSDGFDYGIYLSPNFDNTTNSFYKKIWLFESFRFFQRAITILNKFYFYIC